MIIFKNYQTKFQNNREQCKVWGVRSSDLSNYKCALSYGTYPTALTHGTLLGTQFSLKMIYGVISCLYEKGAGSTVTPVLNELPLDFTQDLNLGLCRGSYAALRTLMKTTETLVLFPCNSGISAFIKVADP